MKKIELTQGKFALVDDEDFEWLNKFKWCAIKKRQNGKFYAVRANGKTTEQMHKKILPCPNGFQIDHKDGDGLNNQRTNLRICTVQQNLRNRGKTRSNTSGYKGVTWHKQGKKWMAQICVKQHECIGLGLFDTKEDAALAYNIAAERYYGEFAILNKIEKK